MSGGTTPQAWSIPVHEQSTPLAYDVARRDFGLLFGALTLARLATGFEPARRPA
jgi:hypothetical protein